jgi:drug/metabolite transporter (DMT)-like permease
LAATDTAARPASTLSTPAAAGLLVLGAIAMGASPIFVRLADVGPFASAFWRTALALPFLYAWMRAEEAANRNAPRPGPNKAVWLAGLFFAGDLIFWHLSIFGTTVANATFFACLAPVWVMLFAVLLGREKVSRAAFAGLGLCLAGGLTLVGRSVQIDPDRLIGDLYGVITSVFFASYILAISAGRATHGAARLSFQSTAITAGALLAVALATEPTLLPSSLAGVAALVGLALVSQVAGQGLLAIALGRLPAVFSSLVIFIEAVAAAALGWVLLAEPLGPLEMAGGLVLLAGIYIARPRRPTPQPLPDEAGGPAP